MMVASPGQKGADYAARLDPAKVAALGYRFVVRYINGSTDHWKVLTPRERDAIHAAGLGLMCVWETTASRPLSGAAGGRQDGWRAAVDLDRLGCPRNIAVLAAVDIDVTAANLRQVVAYLEGFRDAVGRPAGVYGDFDVIDAVKGWSAVNWQANARWWSRHPNSPPDTPLRVHPAAHMRQYLPTTTPAGELDPNVCLRPVRFWHPNPPTPPSKDDNVKTLQRPERILDTRNAGVPLRPGHPLEVSILGNEVVVNLTVVAPASAGYLVAWGSGDRPATSNVNFAAGQSVANLARVMTDDGVMRVESTATCHLVVDLQAAG